METCNRTLQVAVLPGGVDSVDGDFFFFGFGDCPALALALALAASCFPLFEVGK